MTFRSTFTNIVGAVSLLCASAHAAVTITFGSFVENPTNSLVDSPATLSATDGDSTSIVSTAVLDATGLTVEAAGGDVDLTAINSSYVDYVSIDFDTTTTVSVSEISYYYNFVNGNRGNRFTRVTVNVLDPNDGVSVLDTVTLAENNTGTVDNATITQSVTGLDSGTLFQVQYFLRSSETWGDQDMDNISVTMAVIPEPSTAALLSSLFGVCLLRRRRW